MTGQMTAILCPPEGVVDQRVLHEGGEHEADTDALPHVDSLGVGHGRQRGVDGGRLGYMGTIKVLTMRSLTCVDMVSSVVTPSATRAGTALGSSQKLTQETMTSMQPGT